MFGLLLRSDLGKWWKRRNQEILAEFLVKERTLTIHSEDKLRFLKENLESYEREVSGKLEIVEREKRNLEDIERRVLDRRLELERVNEELKIQIRLIEAKASPDSIWTSAFSQGVSKSWDMMLPIMMEGIFKLKETIRNQEIDNSIPRIEEVVTQRINDIGNYELIKSHNLESKRKECLQKLTIAENSEDKIKLSSYIKILDWVLGSKNGN